MTVLAKVFGTQVRQSILALDVVDADLALLRQFLPAKITQRDVLCSRTVGAVAGDVQRRHVVDIQRHAAEALIEAKLQHHVGEEHHLLHCQSCRHELCLHHRLCDQPLQSHLEAVWGVSHHHDV